MCYLYLRTRRKRDKSFFKFQQLHSLKIEAKWSECRKRIQKNLQIRNAVVLFLIFRSFRTSGTVHTRKYWFQLFHRKLYCCIRSWICEISSASTIPPNHIASSNWLCASQFSPLFKNTDRSLEPLACAHTRDALRCVCCCVPNQWTLQYCSTRGWLKTRVFVKNALFNNEWPKWYCY